MKQLTRDAVDTFIDGLMEEHIWFDGGCLLDGADAYIQAFVDEYAVTEQEQRVKQALINHFAPQWRTEPPTEPGWYWMTFLGDEEVTIAGIFPDEDGFLTVNGQHAAASYHKDFRWLGPLPQPEVTTR